MTFPKRFARPSAFPPRAPCPSTSLVCWAEWFLRPSALRITPLKPHLFLSGDTRLMPLPASSTFTSAPTPDARFRIRTRPKVFFQRTVSLFFSFLVTPKPNDPTGFVPFLRSPMPLQPAGLRLWPPESILTPLITPDSKTDCSQQKNPRREQLCKSAQARHKLT